jgi:hypothetical protein
MGVVSWQFRIKLKILPKPAADSHFDVNLSQVSQRQGDSSIEP